MVVLARSAADSPADSVAGRIVAGIDIVAVAVVHADTDTAAAAAAAVNIRKGTTPSKETTPAKS